MAKTVSSLDLQLVRLDRRNPTPLNQQLSAALRAAIQNGQLSAGFRLPSTRDLAIQLAVSRTTVISAYDQLGAEGYLTSTVGRGTRVSLQLPEEAFMVRFQCDSAAKHSQSQSTANNQQRLEFSEFGRTLSTLDFTGMVFAPEIKPFRAGIPALDEFPVALWSQLIRKVWKNISVNDLSYGEPEGWRPLRRAVANYVRAYRGVRCTDEQVLIVNGTQQVFDIISRILLRPADKVLFESPGYLRAKLAFQAAGARLVNVPVDQHGMNLASVAQVSPSARLAYVTPSHQYPLGVTMAIDRRMQLIEWATLNQGWIVEDDYDSEFRYTHRPIPALQGLDPHDRTIYVGSFSKVMYPSLGIGYVVVPTKLCDTFRLVLATAGRPPSKVDQIALAEFIEDGHFARHLRRMRLVHEGRRTALVESLSSHLGHALQIEGAEAGLHCTALLDQRWRDHVIVKQAAERGVFLRALSEFFDVAPPAEHNNGLVFGFACATPAQIRGAIRKLRPLFDT
jgi:GntR family transcriptional regulator/MocR family aminotransferase